MSETTPRSGSGSAAGPGAPAPAPESATSALGPLMWLAIPAILLIAYAVFFL
jgi:hypothetical protein